jgi:hypothetical protein
MNRGNRAMRRGLALLSVASAFGGVACAGDSRSGRWGELTSVDARVDVLVSDAEVAGTFTPLVDSFIADDSGVYWYDGRGAVFARRDGDAEVAQLKPPLARPPGEYFLEFAIGMADDEARLYVGQAFLETNVVDHFPVPEFVPPGRLVVIPKNGDPPTVVVELEDATITPVASDATRIIVFVEGANGGYYQLLRSSLELERLPLQAPFYSSYRDGDANPERGEIDVGPGYALTRQERLVEPDFRVEQNFVLHDIATGDERPLPGMGEPLSFETALDARHAYWFSYGGGRPGELAPTEPRVQLARVDIESGALTLLNTPGFQSDSGAHLVGQTADRLFVATAGQILAIEKP